MKKRILAMMMATALCVSSVPFSVCAEEIETEVDSISLSTELEENDTAQPAQEEFVQEEEIVEEADQSKAITEEPTPENGVEETNASFDTGAAEESVIDDVEVLTEENKDEETDPDVISEDEETVTKEAMQESSYGLSNPRSEAITNSSGKADLKTTWDCVYFGNYPQSDSTGATKEPIKWRVLSVNGNDAFLLADKNLDGQPYNTKYRDVTWETCTLRTWLNNDFYYSAFDSGEQSAITATTVINDDNPEYGTEGGNDTQDKVYLLSITEASDESYGFPNVYSVYSATRFAKNTAYAEAQGARSSSDAAYSGNGWCWLRSPGYNSRIAAIVRSSGYVGQDGNDVIYYDAVRPALHLNLSSSVWSYAGTVSSGDASGTVNTYPINLKKDVWNFKNPDKGGISYQVYKDMFGEVKGYIAYSKGGNGDGGLCYGMAQTVLASYLGFPKVSSYEAIGGFTPPEKLWDVQPYAYNYDINSSAMDLIRHANVYQYTFNSRLDSAMTKDDVEGLYEAAIDFQENRGEPVSITISTGYLFDKGFHELAVIGVKKESDDVAIKVYDCNYPGLDTFLVLYGSPGAFTGKWEYVLNDNGVYKGSWRSDDDLNSHFKYRTITNDLINRYKSNMGISKLSGSKDNSNENLMIALDKNAQGMLCYGGESVNIEEIYETESNCILPIEVATGDNEQSNGIICWLSGNEDSFTCQDISADSEITFAGDEAAISAKTSMKSDITADVTTNTITIAEASGTEFSVDYDYIENDFINRVEVTGVAEGDVTIVPDGNQMSVDGATDVQVKTTSFKIEKDQVEEAEQNTETAKTISITKATVTGIADKTFTGKAIKQTPVVKVNGVTLKANADYTVAYANNTNAGTATVTINGKGNYTGTIIKTFTIAKATNTLTVKVNKPSVKYSKLKKKKQTIKASKAFTVSSAQGKGTYKLVSVKKAKFKKYFKVSKAGKITVKKGLKKGTYKLKVNVTAAGNANYQPMTKTVTVKIKVK